MVSKLHSHITSNEMSRAWMQHKWKGFINFLEKTAQHEGWSDAKIAAVNKAGNELFEAIENVP